jgi:class 3 adenylate cyclase/ligand-binding sensor domain-containing protein
MPKPRLHGIGDVPRWLATAVLMLFTIHCTAQERILRQFTTDDGMVSNGVSSVVRDSLGFVWFGSEKGLTRFNGSSFKHYDSGVNDKSGLFNTAVNALEIDREGTLWVSFVQGGISRYDYTTDRFEHFVHGYSDTTAYFLSPMHLGFNHEGALMIENTDFSAFCFNQEMNRFELYEPWKDNLEGARQVFVDRDQNYWLQGKLDGKGQVAIYSPTRDEIVQSFSFSGFIEKVVEWPEDVYWLGTWGRGLIRYEKVIDSLVSCIPGQGALDLPGSVVKDLQPDNMGNLWIATDLGLVTLSEEQARVCRPQYDFVPVCEEYTGEPLKNWFECLFYDEDHRMWIGTQNEGLYLSEPDSFDVTLLRFTKDQGPGAINLESLISVEDDRGWFWFTLEDGIAHYNPETGKYKVLNPQRKDTVRILVNEVVGMNKAPDGRLAISFQGGEMALMDIYSYETEHFTLDSKDPYPHGMLSSFRDRNGKTWVTTYLGLLRHSGSEFNKFDTIIPGHDGRWIDQDRDGFIWVGSWNMGLAKIDPQSLEIQWFNPKEGDAFGLLGSDSHLVYVTEDGKVWTLTSKGPQVFNPTTNQFELIPVASQMSLMASRSFCPDKNGNLWFLTLHGLYFWDRRTDRISFLDHDYGLPRAEYHEVRSMSDGMLYVSTEIGCLRIDPETVPHPSVPKAPVFTEAFLESTDTTSHLSLMNADELNASFQDNFMEISFAPMNFGLTGKTSFEYMLDRGAGTWVDIGEETKITFLDLPSGNYNLRLRGRNEWGEYGPESILALMVVPPWWLSATALALYVILAISGVIAYNQFRLYRLRKRQRILEGIVEVRTKEIRLERDRSESLLLNILPAEVAEELKAKGEAEAKLIDEVTVLFTDFKGFTHMSEKLSPRQLVKDLNECFSAFDRICEKYRVEKIKTIGDSYMAAGGLPTPSEEHAKNVLCAAFEMRDFIEEGKKKKMEGGLPYFEIRIGIHTGPVVAGIVGVKKFQYDIWGDTVNTASRMESSGEVGRVNTSQTTYELIKSDPNFSFEYRGKVQAKGKGKVDMWFVEANDSA